MKPKELIDLYLNSINRDLRRDNKIPNEDYKDMVMVLRDLQKNMEKNKMVIMIK